MRRYNVVVEHTYIVYGADEDHVRDRVKEKIPGVVILRVAELPSLDDEPRSPIIDRPHLARSGAR